MEMEEAYKKNFILKQDKTGEGSTLKIALSTNFKRQISFSRLADKSCSGQGSNASYTNDQRAATDVTLVISAH